MSVAGPRQLFAGCPGPCSRRSSSDGLGGRSQWAGAVRACAPDVHVLRACGRGARRTGAGPDFFRTP